MTANQLRAVCAFEASLTVGAPVEVCWTNHGAHYRALGTIAKVNRKSLWVRLTEEVPSKIGCGAHPAGREILVPRIEALETWSPGNRVEPVGGYSALE